MLPLPPEDGVALDIEVTAHQWHWDVYYPEQGIRLHNELHIPANTPVDIYVTSSDVIHSFWVPRLAGKIDAIPGPTPVCCAWRRMNPATTAGSARSSAAAAMPICSSG